MKSFLFSISVGKLQATISLSRSSEISISTSSILGICQVSNTSILVKLCLGRRNGTSLAQETGNIQTGQDQIELPGQVIGRQRVPTRSSCRMVNVSGLKKLWFSTPGKLQKARKQTGLCTSIDSSSILVAMEAPSWMIGCYVESTRKHLDLRDKLLLLRYKLALKTRARTCRRRRLLRLSSTTFLIRSRR
uniref:Uncharacterized protein n=1 Tax=Brassica campestris TaxID=3711 RepID=A0A3P5ZLG4_BRACM|nr:unnamed protein product [Brassica rapa]